MNRRDFIRLAGLSLLAGFLPPINLENEMELGDIWVKMANNLRLTPQENDFLKRMGNETQLRNSFVAGNTTADSKLKTEMPFFPIFSEILAVDTPSFTVDIPGGYKHLQIVCSGRDTSAGTLFLTLEAQLNSDTGNNYSSQFVKGQLNVASAQSTSGASSMTIGVLANGGAPANSAATSTAIFANYRGSYFKDSITTFGINNSGIKSTGVVSDNWANVSQVQSIKIFASSDNIAAGTAISIYLLQ